MTLWIIQVSWYNSTDDWLGWVLNRAWSSKPNLNKSISKGSETCIDCFKMPLLFIKIMGIYYAKCRNQVLNFIYSHYALLRFLTAEYLLRPRAHVLRQHIQIPETTSCACETEPHPQKSPLHSPSPGVINTLTRDSSPVLHTKPPHQPAIY